LVLSRRREDDREARAAQRLHKRSDILLGPAVIVRYDNVEGAGKQGIRSEEEARAAHDKKDEMVKMPLN